MSGCRGEIDSDDDMPRIRIRYVGTSGPDSIRHIEHGIEEEGVSWVVQRVADAAPTDLAYRAAVDSRLKIGVGVTPESRAVIHHEQLPADDPLFDIDDIDAATARTVGTNAGRLAKGLPLKPLQ